MNTGICTGTLRVAGAEGIELQVRRWGREGPTCLFIHGSGDDGAIWAPFASSLPPHYRSVALDLRGHGDSNWHPHGEYGIDCHVADVTRLLETLQVDRFALVGHSLGADIAIRIAAMKRAAVRALVLVDFAPGMNLEAIEHGRQWFRTLFRPYRSADEFAGVLASRRSLVSLTIIREIASRALKVADGGYVLKCDPALLHVAYEPDEPILWEAVSRISCPVLLVRGAGSAFLPKAAAVRMLQRLKNGRLSEIAIAGHAVMTDNPVSFGAALRSFLLEQVCHPQAAHA